MGLDDVRIHRRTSFQSRQITRMSKAKLSGIQSTWMPAFDAASMNSFECLAPSAGFSVDAQRRLGKFALRMVFPFPGRSGRNSEDS